MSGAANVDPALARDGTSPVSAAEQLGETERRFEIMADAAPVLLWMAREDGKCTFFNQTWIDFTGRTQEEEWGVGWAEGVHYEDLQGCLDTFVDAFSARRKFEMEYRLRRADGEFRWILDRGVPRYTPSGQFAGYIGSCVDITDRKLLEADLRRAVTAKDEFLGLVSHELRTPVTALALQLERLRSDAANLSPKQGDIVRRMGSAMERLIQLIESVLQFSCIERGRLKVEPCTFDLSRLLQEEVLSIQPAAERKGLTLSLDVAPGLPMLHSDPALVRLIISNLLTNAIKFTDAGWVELGAASEGRHVRVSVRDSGPGIPKQLQERVFDPFEQLEPSRGKHRPGVGLGLSLSRAMAQALDGEVSLVSELGQGSSFSLVLPARFLGG